MGKRDPLMLTTTTPIPKTFPNINKELLTYRFNESDFNEFSAYLFAGVQPFYEMIETFCEIYGEENLTFEARRNGTYFSLGLRYGHETLGIMSLESSPKYLKYTIGHSFKSYLFTRASHDEGYKFIEQGKYSADEDFADLTKILKHHKQKYIDFYGKKYGLDSAQQQQFAVWLELFNRIYTNARPRKDKTIWKSYPKFYEYVATLVKLNFSQATKIAFIKNSIPADLVASLDGAPDEWLKEILEIAI